MGVLDALTILGAGAGRGYRASQETQRQIAEQKRRALLEEREALVRERSAKAQEQLTESQIQTQALERAIGQFGLDVNKKKFATSQAPITPGGTPLKLNFLGNSVEIPSNLQSVTDLEGLIKQLSDESFKSKHPEYYRNYPPVGQTKLEPRARKIDYILKAAGAATGGGPTTIESTDPEAYNTRVAKTFDFILGKMKETDPEAFAAIKAAALAETDSTNTEDLPLDLDREALPPKKNNRFTGIKVKPQGKR